jgi:pimeloyl-ACP methyl ester carboxylesterase
LGATLLGVAGAVAAQRAAAKRLRARPDREAGEAFGTLPPEVLGPVQSFDGTQLAVRAAGPVRAPTILFAHGFGLDMTTWHYQWRAFSGRYRCILFDHRAHGRSGKAGSGDYSIRALGRDLKAMLDMTDGKAPVILVGHDLGGMAILSLAEQHPEEFGGRVAGVVLADTAASDVGRAFLAGVPARAERALRPLTDRLAADPGRTHRGRSTGGVVSDLSLLIARATEFGPDASPSQVEYIAGLSRAAPTDVWVTMLREFVQADLREALGSVKVPALVVVGDRDRLTPSSSAAALLQGLPDARGVVITRAGHLPMMEQHRVFNDALERYLDDVAPVKKRRRKAAVTEE